MAYLLGEDGFLLAYSAPLRFLFWYSGATTGTKRRSRVADLALAFTLAEWRPTDYSEPHGQAVRVPVLYPVRPKMGEADNAER